MDDLDSGWDEPLSSLDSDLATVTFDVGEAMNGFDQIELSKQVQEMRDDPTLPFPSLSISNGTLDKQSSSTDCTSLSSEIFLATRLLHDETLDNTMLPVLGDNSSPYSDCHNINSFLGSPFENDAQQDHFDANNLTTRENFDSDFLLEHGNGMKSSSRIDYDEDGSNKSWTACMSPSEIMPAPLQTIPKRKVREKKPTERKRITIPKAQKRNVALKKTNAELLPPSPVPYIVPPSLAPTNAIHSSISSAVKRESRKVPSYLKKYFLNDSKYHEIFACKNCYGIYTTLDSAMFHPCLKKRRGRRPKLLQDCIVPL